MTAPDLNTIYREHGPRFLAVAAQLTGDHQLAEDAVQEAFVAAHRGLTKFRGEASPETWLYRIVIRSATKMRERRRARLARDRKAKPATNPAPAPAIEQDELWQAIDALPDELRLVVSLMNLRDLPASAVGDILAIPEGTVWSRASRARRLLRTHTGLQQPRTQLPQHPHPHGTPTR